MRHHELPASSRAGLATPGLLTLTPWAWPPGEDALTQLLDSLDGGEAAHPAPVRDGLVAVLNGLLGDHLQRADHALATPMQLRQAGHRLNLPLSAAALATPARRRVVLLIHDLCLDEHSWQREGHDYAAQLGATLDATVLHLRYSSGLRVSANGACLARLLARLHQEWPVPLQALDIVGHGMGGLVARSACAQADAGLVADARWRATLRRMVFLGTPHHGLPLERMRSWLRRVLGLRQASAPLARLARLRSDGVADLRHGNLLAADWQPHDHFDTRDHRCAVALPAGVECHALAGRLPGRGGDSRHPGDGLVPVDSALGRHAQPGRALAFAAQNCWVGDDLHHLELLSHARVYRRLLYALSD